MAKRMVVWARVVHAKQQHLSSKVWVGIFQALVNDRLASDVRVPSHSVRSCLRDFQNIASRCGCIQFRHVVFVSMPVGREQLYSWICLQRGFLFCGCSDLVWFLFILFSPFDSAFLCAGWQDVASFAAFRFEKLRPAVFSSDVMQHAERFDCVVSVLLAHIRNRTSQAWSMSEDGQHATLHVNFADSRARWLFLDLATSSKLRRSAACPFGWRLLLFFAAARSCTPLRSDWVVSAEHQCMVADLTGQPLLEHTPQRNFWKLGLSHAYRDTCEQISGCTIDVPFRCECGCGCARRTMRSMC